jgi:hypothetical protein
VQLLKARFQRALCEALEKPTTDLERAQPESMIAAMAWRLTLDAAAGRTS